jgi:hypothetical protein
MQRSCMSYPILRSPFSLISADITLDVASWSTEEDRRRLLECYTTSTHRFRFPVGPCATDTTRVSNENPTDDRCQVCSGGTHGPRA